MKKSLKTLAAVVLAALTLSLTGCTKDPADLIIGTWQAYFSEYTSTWGSQSYTGTDNYENETSQVTYKNDGTFVTTTTYTENGSTRTHTENGTYVVNDKTLTMTFTDEGESFTEAYNIDEISNKELTLSMNESGTEEGVSYSYKMTIKFKKI